MNGTQSHYSYDRNEVLLAVSVLFHSSPRVQSMNLYKNNKCKNKSGIEFGNEFVSLAGLHVVLVLVRLTSCEFNITIKFKFNSITNETL